MDITLFKEGCTIMFIGMSTVFVFLVIMIMVVNLTTWILNYVNKYFPEELPVEKSPAKTRISSDEDVALAIACAIHQSNNVT